jgi:hypothetical protein
MTERRYSDEEVAAIFEQASTTERTGVPASPEGKGVTLAALQDIGREVGISPEAIAHAARALDHTGRPKSRTFMGMTIGVGQTVEFDRPLSDADWGQLVADLRETFEARGTVRYDGPFRQWTNGNLQALVEPTPSGHRVRLQTVKGDARALMTVGLVMLGMSVATLIAIGLTAGMAEAGSMAGLQAVLGLGMFGIGALRLPAWARRRKAQIDAVLARLTLSKTGELP